MAIVWDYSHILSDKQSLALMPLIERPAGIYYAKLDLAGNSVLSTLLVESCDVGASVLVQYFDTTTGDEIGEANLLKEHNLLNAGLLTDKILVGNTHDKAFLKATVTGGNVKFSVYATIVSTSATELADAIIEENQSVNFITDKAVAIGGLSENTGVWKFIRIADDGSLVVRSVTVFENVEHSETTILHNVEQTVFSKTYTNDTRIIKLLCEANGFGLLSVYINSVLWAKSRNAWNDRNIKIDMGAKLLKATDVLEVKIKNVNYNNNNATYNLFVYEG